MQATRQRHVVLSLFSASHGCIEWVGITTAKAQKNQKDRTTKREKQGQRGSTRPTRTVWIDLREIRLTLEFMSRRKTRRISSSGQGQPGCDFDTRVSLLSAFHDGPASRLASRSVRVCVYRKYGVVRAGGTLRLSSGTAGWGEESAERLSCQ